MASPQIKTPAEIIFDNTPSASATTPASGQTLLGVDETTKKLYSVNDAGVKTNYDASSGGSGGSGIMGQDEGVPVGTGTTLNVTGNLLALSISGSVLRLNQIDPTFPQEVIGIYGHNQGFPLGTGNVLNVDGSRLSLSISGSVLRLTNSPDPQELIGVFGRDQGTNLGTGTTIDWGLGMNAAITGSVLFVHPFAGGSHSQVWTRNTGTVQGASWATPSSSGGAFWTNVPGSPTRTGNTTFTLTDTGNANLYNKLISKGTCLKWTETSTVKQAMVISATYATDTVTVTIIGDTMASIDANSLKYGAEKARVERWVYFGTVGATGTDVAGHRYAPMDMKIYGADIRLGTAGSGTTTVDINDDGTTMFTTKPSITTTNTTDLNNTADNGTIAAEESKLTVDFDAVAGTAGVDMYVDLYWTPDLNRYLT